MESLASECFAPLYNTFGADVQMSVCTGPGVFCRHSDPLIPPRADMTYEVELLSVTAPLDVTKVTEAELVDVV